MRNASDAWSDYERRGVDCENEYGFKWPLRLKGSIVSLNLFRFATLLKSICSDIIDIGGKQLGLIELTARYLIVNSESSISYIHGLLVAAVLVDHNHTNQKILKKLFSYIPDYARRFEAIWFRQSTSKAL